MSSFAAELWDQAESVIKHSHDRRREVEEYIKALTRRIEAEETYAKNVEEAAKIAEKAMHTDDCSSTLAFSSFRFDCINRSSQSLTFAKSLKDQILKILKEMLSTQSQEAKQMEKDYRRMQKEQYQLQYNIVKAKNKFEQQYKDKEDTLILNQIVGLTAKTSKDKRAKTMSKTNEIMKYLSELSAIHQKAIAQYNTFMDQYYCELDQLLGLYQLHQQDRLAKQEENIIKTLVFQTSMMKNLEYDIATITNQVEKAKSVNAIQEFINKNKSPIKPSRTEQSTITKSMLGNSLYSMVNKKFEKTIELEGNKEFRTYIESRIKGEEQGGCSLFHSERLTEINLLLTMVEESWKGQLLTFAQVEDLRRLLHVDTNRLALLINFKQYQMALNIVMPFEAYNQILTIIQVLLDCCYQHQDVFVARKITNIAFAFYTILPLNQKKYLHSSLNGHKLFSKGDFWQASIFESIQEEFHFNSGGQFEEEQELKQKSLVLGQLAMYCHQMILLGFSSKQVRQIIGKCCRMYSIPDDQNRDLARTISASSKKYQQLFSLQAQSSVSAQSQERDRREIDQIPESTQGQKAPVLSQQDLKEKQEPSHQQGNYKRKSSTIKDFLGF